MDWPSADVLQFDKCCYIFELRTGCLIIGYLGVINSIFGIAMGAIGISGGYPQEAFSTKLAKMSPEVGWVIIITSIIAVGFYVILLVGVYKKKPALVNAAWIFMIVYIEIQVISMFYVHFSTHGHGVLWNLFRFIVMLFWITVPIYLGLCVRSYIVLMKDESQSSRPSHA